MMRKTKTKKMLKSKQACYYCQSFFPRERIKKYVDNGKTALCPVCNVDSVVDFEEAISKLQQSFFKTIDSINSAVKLGLQSEDEKNRYTIGTCMDCVHNTGCDIQDWNNSRADVEPEYPFGCIFWERENG